MPPEKTLILVSVIGAACVAVALWALVGRARADARAATANARADEAQRELGHARESLEATGQKLEAAEDRIQDLNIDIARSDERERAIARREQELQTQHEEMLETSRRAFESLAANALARNNEQFLTLAGQRLEAERTKTSAQISEQRSAIEQLVKPIGDTLKKADEQLSQIEHARVQAFARIGEQMKNANRVNADLRRETGKLVRALREPHVRGRYGEIQLQRVAELAGMTAYCDFDTQPSVRTSEGRLQRPDMVVRLPNQREVVVDAKTNISAYMDAIEAQDREEEERHLDRFAQHVYEQATALSKKKYWASYDGSPEFVVMFVPGDQFLDAALARRPQLLEHAAERQVILASPSTLIGLLKAVAVGWHEHTIAERAAALRDLGAELHERAAVAFRHATDVGESLRRTVEKYNSFVGSVDARLMPTLRKFEESGVRSGKQLPSPAEVTVTHQAA